MAVSEYRTQNGVQISIDYSVAAAASPEEHQRRVDAATAAAARYLRSRYEREEKARREQEAR